MPTQADSADEPHGTVTVTLGAGTGYTVGSPASAGVTVRDDDAPAGGGPTARALLVSNTGRSDDGSSGLNRDRSQGFTTGSHAGGYTLTRVDLEMQDTAATTPTFSVSVHQYKGGSLALGPSLGTLTQQGSVPGTFGTVQFTASSTIDLEPNTRYAVVIDVQADPSDDTKVRHTTSSDEDPDGSAGWSMDDGHGRKVWDTDLVDVSFGWCLRRS